MNKFKAGDRVRHEAFGDGTVLNYIGNKIVAVELDGDAQAGFDDTCTFPEDELVAIT